MQTHVVIPVKELAQAKSRLALTLGADERRALVLEMLGRMLDLLLMMRQNGSIAQVWVVSADAQVRAFAERCGARVMLDNAGTLNGALEQARLMLRRTDADAMLVLHADLPLIEASDITAILGSLRAGSDLVLVPDAAERGTNAVGLWLSAALPFLFGAESFARHCAAAGWQELIVDIYRSPTIALDVDTPPMLARYRSEVAQGMVGCCGI
jgi:2-phospho-L-lactate guanylyltransferase